MTKNNNEASNQHIIMISEGSCDTEDLSNDAENSGINKKFILKHLNKFKHLNRKPLF